MTSAFLAIVLAVGWVFATGDVTVPNLALGAALGGIAMLLIRDRLTSSHVLGRAGRILALAGIFVVELIASAVRVAVLVLRPDMKRHLKPAFIAYPLRLESDAEITLLANLITLTPGTLSVDVSDDRSRLYIHAIDARDREALIGGIAASFERRVEGVFR